MKPIKKIYFAFSHLRSHVKENFMPYAVIWCLKLKKLIQQVPFCVYEFFFSLIFSSINTTISYTINVSSKKCIPTRTLECEKLSIFFFLHLTQSRFKKKIKATRSDAWSWMKEKNYAVTHIDIHKIPVWDNNLKEIEWPTIFI